jgi:K+-sensing histidine kinase KdpD
MLAHSPASPDRERFHQPWVEPSAAALPSPARARHGGAAERKGEPAPAAASAAGSIPWLSTTLSAALARTLHGPLATLVTCAELLLDDLDRLDRAQLRALALAIRCRTLWLECLVENLLCAAAIRDHCLRLHRQPVQPAEVVREVLLVVEPLLARRQQRAHLQIVGGSGGEGGSDATIMADSRRLGQALLSLLLDASERAPRGARISVALARRQRFLRVSVAGCGPGLLPGGDVLVPPQPAEPPAGHRVEGLLPGGDVLVPPPATAGGGGMQSFGLAVARAIVEAHGGRVGVHRRRRGGAGLWFELPLVQPATGA